MKIAVLMSTYNGEKYIKEQIDSILNQEGDFQLDLWVRDDGSKDKTKVILDEYAEQGKLRWYSNNNLGPARSFLDLVRHCSGYDFYAFADQDDYWMPYKISAAVRMLEGKIGPQLYFANAELVDSELNSMGRNVYKISPKLDFETLTCAGGILGCTTVFNAELAQWVQSRDLPELIVMHDFYIDELCLALDGEITCDLQPVMKYRQHENNVVGVSYGLVGTLKERFFTIRKKAKVSIADQSNEILKLYRSDISSDKVKWLTKVAFYRSSHASRISLAFSHRTIYMNRNMGLKLRLSILFGNR